MIVGVSGDHGTQDILPGLEFNPRERSITREMKQKRRQFGSTVKVTSIKQTGIY